MADGITLLQTYTDNGTFTAPQKGSFQIEIFGASGSGGTSDRPNKFVDEQGEEYNLGATGGGGGGGGYAVSIVRLCENDVINVVVGRVGGTSSASVVSSYDTEYNHTLSVTSGGNGGNGRVSRYSYGGSAGPGGVASGGNIRNLNGNAGAAGNTPTSDRVGDGPYYGGHGGAAAVTGGNAGGNGGGYDRSGLYSSAEVITSPTYGADGFVKISLINTPPSDPLSITYGQPQAGRQLTLTTGGSTDDDGDVITYVFERSIDGGVYTEVGQTSALSLNDTIPTEGTTYTARVKAVDPAGGESAYVIGETLNISYNSPPEITGENVDLGTLTNPPVYEYTVTDSNDGDTVTVVEKVITVSGEEYLLREYTAELGTETSVLWDCCGWLCCENGVNKLIITATDNKGASATRTLTFTRAVSYISAARAVATDAMPTKVLLSLYPAPAMLPGDCTIEAYVTNNPFDDSPVWENISGKLNRIVHTFVNSTCTNGYGIGYRFCIDKGEERIYFDQAVLRFA